MWRCAYEHHHFRYRPQSPFTGQSGLGQGAVIMYERHGHTRCLQRSVTHYAWTNMVARCTNPKRWDYGFYGGRGIKICPKWRNSFALFLVDMGERPLNRSLDRINNSGNYEPGNCRWATKDEQMQNTRATRIITFNGESMGITAWARKLGLKHGALQTRFKYGWSLEKALTTRKTR